ncbi:MAG: hypothetical protein L6Q72_15845, partial [Burkholderiaceae bacterium]|nr:hypothetical protein [Burkholderiaceae bacterium]
MSFVEGVVGSGAGAAASRDATLAVRHGNAMTCSCGTRARNPRASSDVAGRDQLSSTTVAKSAGITISSISRSS